MLTPEESIEIQNAIGADIMMQLDDVVDVRETDYERFKTATYRQVLHLGSRIYCWVLVRVANFISHLREENPESLSSTYK